MNYPFNLHFVF